MNGRGLDVVAPSIEAAAVVSKHNAEGRGSGGGRGVVVAVLRMGAVWAAAGIEKGAKRAEKGVQLPHSRIVPKVRVHALGAWMRSAVKQSVGEARSARDVHMAGLSRTSAGWSPVRVPQWTSAWWTSSLLTFTLSSCLSRCAAGYGSASKNVRGRNGAQQRRGKGVAAAL